MRRQRWFGGQVKVACSAIGPAYFSSRRWPRLQIGLKTSLRHPPAPPIRRLEAGLSISASPELSSEARSALRKVVGLAPGGLLLFRDQDAHARPMFMPQSRWGNRAQRHYTHILCFERIPCFEVISHNLCAGIGPGKGIGWRRCI